jgi:hypothetical protein
MCMRARPYGRAGRCGFGGRGVTELHGEILREGWMIARQARPCMNLHGMYR